MGLLITLFWISGDVFSGFQSQSGQPYSGLVEAYILHIPWNSHLVQQLPTSCQPAWQLSHSHPHTYSHALMGLKTGTFHATTVSQCETRLHWLSYAGSYTFIFMVVYEKVPILYFLLQGICCINHETESDQKQNQTQKCSKHTFGITLTSPKKEILQLQAWHWFQRW